MKDYMKEQFNPAKIFNSLSESEKAKILANQEKKRLEKLKEKINIDELTNSKISLMEKFQNFCNEKNIEPTKRQAGKNREKFKEWLEDK